MKPITVAVGTLLAATLGTPPAAAQDNRPSTAKVEQPQSADVEITGHVLEPAQAAPDRATLELPEGFTIDVFAEGLVTSALSTSKSAPVRHLLKRSF